jgi:hypothetical protein
MTFSLSKDGKQKIMQGMVSMLNSPFYFEGDEFRVRYDELRIARTDDGRLAIELCYLSKSVMTMTFDMPGGAQRIVLEADGSMVTTIET